MHPGQLIAHFINTAIITAIVAGLVLWRYKVGVLAGMNSAVPLELPIPPPVEPARPPQARCLRRECPGVGAAGAAAHRA